MSRAFVDLRELRVMCDKLTKLPGFENPEYIKTALKNLDDPVKLAATNLVRFFGKDLDTIDRMFSTFKYKDGSAPRRMSDASMTKGVVPLIAFVKGQPDQCIVFQNIPVNYGTSVDSNLINVTPVSHYERHLAAFDAGYTSDLADENKKKKWTRPFNTLKRTEQLTLARMLTKYFSFPDRKDDYIRDLADHIASERAAYDLKLGTTIEDFMQMYTSGPASCMSYTGEKKAGWRNAMQENDPPTGFYSYIPGVFGGMLMKKKTLHARCLIVTQGGKRRYSRIYFASEVARDTMVRMMRDEGITELPGGYLSIRASFKIPGRLVVNSTSSYYMPYPYIDNCHTVFYGRFDRVTKDFYIEAFPSTDESEERKKINKDPQWTLMPAGGTTGYFLSSNLESFVCKHCGMKRTGKDINSSKSFIHHQTSEFACRTECASALGWVSALRGDGIYQVLNKEDCLEDQFAKGYYYTTERACMERGGKLAFTDIFAPDEEPGVSANGINVARNGETISIDGHSFETKWKERFGKTSKGIAALNALPVAYMSVKKVKEVTLYDDMSDIVEVPRLSKQQQDEIGLVFDKYLPDGPPPKTIQVEAMDSRERPIMLIRRVE